VARCQQSTRSLIGSSSNSIGHMSRGSYRNVDYPSIHALETNLVRREMSNVSETSQPSSPLQQRYMHAIRTCIWTEVDMLECTRMRLCNERLLRALHVLPKIEESQEEACVVVSRLAGRASALLQRFAIVDLNYNMTMSEAMWYSGGCYWSLIGR